MNTESLSVEVARLRSGLRVYRVLTVGACVVAVAMAGVVTYELGAAKKDAVERSQNVVRAQRFELVDEAGTERAYLACVEGGAQLAFLRTPTEAMVTLDASRGGALLKLNGETGYLQLSTPAGMAPKDIWGPQIVLQDTSGVSIQMVSAGKGATLRFHESDGRWTHAMRTSP